jgi:hypothetical protein
MRVPSSPLPLTHVNSPGARSELESARLQPKTRPGSPDAMTVPIWGCMDEFLAACWRPDAGEGRARIR